MSHDSGSLPAIPDGRISRVRFWPWLARNFPVTTPSQESRGLSAGSHAPLAFMVCLVPRLAPDSVVLPVQRPGTARSTRPPSTQSPFAWSGRYPFQGGLQAASENVTSPSSLILAHAPDQIPPAASEFLARRVFAGCCQPLLGDGPSRHYLCDPCVGAWTHTPPRSPGALAHYFPEDIGLAPRETRSARGMISAMQLPQRAVFRGCSHSFTFRLPRSLGPQVAPTATAMLPGGRAVYTTHLPEWLPTAGCGIASCPTWATDTAGLSPAGSQPCRLLLPAYGSSTSKADPLIEPGCPIQQGNLCDTTMVGTRLWTGQRRGRSAGWSNHLQLSWLSPFKVFSIRSRKEAPVGRGLTFVPGNVETRIRPITGRRSLLPTSQARTSIRSPCGSPSLAGEDTGLPRSASEVAWG
jgi:hypothetical protein